MKITELSVHNFKNYEELRLTIDSKINLFYGANGSGKTNLLDAIYYLAISKSYFVNGDAYVMRNGSDYFRLKGTFAGGPKPIDIVIKKRVGQTKVIEYQKKKLSSASELLGKIPIVLIAPDDIKLVKQGSKDRRDFVNRILCQSNNSYLERLLLHNRFLAQKNALLKQNGSIDFELLDQYNNELIRHGSELYSLRQQLIDDYKPFVIDVYNTLATDEELVDIDYISQFHDKSMNTVYRDYMSDEIRYKRLLVGLHKDDFEFVLNNRPLKKIGSQGQIKSFLYALRIGEYLYLKQKLTEKPILMLDDYFEKLDQHRLTSLVKLIADDTFDQVFLTDTMLDRTKELLTKFGIDFATYHVDKSEVTTID